MKLYMGLDIHSKRTVYAAQDEQGNLVGQGQVPTTEEGFRQMVAKLKAPPQTPIGLETGTQATWAARRLSAMGMEPVVIDAREVRAKARRLHQKSDRRDAFEICDGLRRGVYVTLVYVPPVPIERLRRILSRRRHFVRVSTQQINAAKFLLRTTGRGRQTASLGTWCAWEKLLKQPELADLHEFLVLHARLWRMAQENVCTLQTQLTEALQPFSDILARLQTFPGVGGITAATFIATLGTPDRFPDSRHVVSYVGLGVSTYDSGERECHGHITKRGSAEMRAMLCEAAHHTAKPHHPLNPYFARTCARHGYKKAVVCVAQRMARILFQMWRHQEDFNVQKLNVRPIRRIRTKRTYYETKKTQAVAVSA